MRTYQNQHFNLVSSSSQNVLYTFHPIFEVQKCFLKELFSKISSLLTDVQLEFKSGFIHEVENISEDSLDSIPSPLRSVKIQIFGRKVYLR